MPAQRSAAAQQLGWLRADGVLRLEPVDRWTFAHEADPASIAAMQRAAVLPANGAVVAVSVTDEVSKFRHRGELVYLPPAWFATMPPPSLPVVMMIGAEINTPPADWLRIGGGGYLRRRVRGGARGETHRF